MNESSNLVNKMMSHQIGVSLRLARAMADVSVSDSIGLACVEGKSKYWRQRFSLDSLFTLSDFYVSGGEAENPKR